jgi:hypothetical protein
MSSLNQVRLTDGTLVEISEWLHWPLYSSCDIGAADPVNVTLFSYVVGQPVAKTPTPAQREANDRDTNMVRKGKMNQDEAFIVMSLFWEPYALTSDSSQPTEAPAPLMSAANLRRLQAALTYELIIGAGTKKADIELPFSVVPQSVGPRYSIAGDSAGTYVGTASECDPGSQYVLNLPVPIGGTGERAKPGNSRTFKLRLKSYNGAVPGLTQTFSGRFWLDGLRQRPA